MSFSLEGAIISQRPDIADIMDIFISKFHHPTQDEVDAIIEQYNILSNRGLDAKLWISRILTEVSRKEPSKRTVPYVIGFIRNRMIHGWGVSMAVEEKLLINLIESKIGKISIDSKRDVYEMLGSYGGTRLTFAINELDVEGLIMSKIRDLVDSQEARGII